MLMSTFLALETKGALALTWVLIAAAGTALGVFVASYTAELAQGVL